MNNNSWNSAEYLFDEMSSCSSVAACETVQQFLDLNIPPEKTEREKLLEISLKLDFKEDLLKNIRREEEKLIIEINVLKSSLDGQKSK